MARLPVAFVVALLIVVVLALPTAAVSARWTSTASMPTLVARAHADLSTFTHLPAEAPFHLRLPKIDHAPAIFNLTHHPAEDWRPAWSPDGSKIAFVSDRTGDWQIYVMNPDGTKVRKLTELVPPSFAEE